MGEDRRIRVLFIYSAASYGGLVRNLSLIANHLDTTYFNVTFVALTSPNDSNNLLQINPREGIELVQIRDVGKLDKTALAEIAKLLTEGNYEVLSAHGHKADFYALLLKCFYKIKIPILSIAHGWVVPGFKMKIYDWIDKFSMRFFSKIVLVHRQQLQELPFFPENKTVVIPNAIPKIPLFSPEQKLEERNRLGLTEGQIAIAFCGRLSPEKGVATALTAFAKLKDIDARFFICGVGTELAKLKQLVETLEIRDKVEFLGFVEDVIPLLQAMDIYCSCSRKEGMPNNVLEAQAVALPVVLSNIPAHRELVGTSESAILVSPTNEQEIADAIKDLATDTHLRSAISFRARENVLDNFSIENRLTKLQLAYKSLISR